MQDLATKVAKAESIVNNYCIGAGTTAFVTGPIPGTSAALIALEVTMVYHIARAFDFHPTIQEAGISVGSLAAASEVLKTFAVEASSALPVIGWFLIKPAIAAGACKAVGKLAMEHYRQKYLEQYRLATQF